MKTVSAAHRLDPHDQTRVELRNPGGGDTEPETIPILEEMYKVVKIGSSDVVDGGTVDL